MIWLPLVDPLIEKERLVGSVGVRRQRLRLDQCFRGLQKIVESANLGKVDR